MTTNRQWLLRERPTGLVGPDHFEQVETDLPTADLGASRSERDRLFLKIDLGALMVGIRECADEQEPHPR